MIERLKRSPFPEVGLFGVAGLLLFAYEYLDSVAREVPANALVPLIEQGTGVMNSCLLFFLVRRLARRVPLDGTKGPVLIHIGALAAFSVAHTKLNWLSREVLFRLVGLGDYHYGVMPTRFLMELPIDVIIYTCFVVGVWSVDRWRSEREHAVETAQLATRLSQARLQNLQLQLQPHFLFNALNTISSTMYQDLEAADAMLARLADLLRYALRTADVQEVPLAVELDALGHYTALLEARFGDDFVCVREVAPGAEAAFVPSLILQPMVENAVRHGGLARTGRGRVVVRAERIGAMLRVEIEDDGPGILGALNASGNGVGLAATGERLLLLYGSQHRFEATNVEGGFRVRLELPWRDHPAVRDVSRVGA
jgi:two-component system LytT family sensor kinase